MTHKDILNSILQTIPHNDKGEMICPTCGGALNLSEDMYHLTCTNPNCSGKLFRRIEVMAKVFGIKSIGIKVAEAIVNDCNLTSMDQLFKLRVMDLLKVSNWTHKMATKVYNSIQSVKEVELSQFIRACQLYHLADVGSKKLADGISTYEDLFNLTPEKIQEIMAPMSLDQAEKLYDSIQTQADEIKALVTHFTIKKTVATQTSTENTLLCVITGEMYSATRSQFQKKYTELKGVRWNSSVTRAVDYLITNSDEETTKFKAAKKLQEQGHKIKIVNEQEFLALMDEAPDFIPEDKPAVIDLFENEEL